MMWFAWLFCGLAFGTEGASGHDAREALLLLNEASAEDFASVDGVDLDTASAIVALRDHRGRLGSVEELRVIHSLSSDALDRLRSRAAVQLEAPVGGGGSTFESPGEVLDQFVHEPTVQQVQQWANAYAKTSPELVQQWLSASKAFAALPQLTLEYRFRDGWDQDFLYRTSDGLEALQPDEQVFPTLEDGGRDQDNWYLVRTRWDLNELVMSSERIRIISEAQDVAKLRDKILAQVTQLYFERRRLQVEILLAPRGDTLGQVKDQLRLMELTANLDALTGGAFSSSLARAGG